MKLCVLDGSGYVHRAFHAIKPMVNVLGEPANAIYGFTNLFLETLHRTDATHVVCVFDKGRSAVRTAISESYKAHRQSHPDLQSQWPAIRTIPQVFGVAVIEEQDVEGDDLIANLARCGAMGGFEVEVVSQDKDLLQLLVYAGTKLYDPVKKASLTAEDAIRKFGVVPSKIAHVQAFMGDPVDGYKGVPGIGQKTAAELINTFGSVDGVLANIDKVKGKATRAALDLCREDAITSLRLALLYPDASKLLNGIVFDTLKRRPIDVAAVDDFIASHGFQRGDHALVPPAQAAA